MMIGSYVSLSKLEWFSLPQTILVVTGFGCSSSSKYLRNDYDIYYFCIEYNHILNILKSHFYVKTQNSVKLFS